MNVTERRARSEGEAQAMKAWRTKAAGIVSIVCADTRAEAKHVTQKSARDAGWAVEWNEIEAKRAGEFDLFAATHGIRGRCVSEEYAR